MEFKGQTKSVIVKHGILPDLVGVGNVTEGLVKENMHVPISVTTTDGIESVFVNVPVSVEPKLVEANLNMSHAAHVVTKEHAGTGSTYIKTRPTWTRVARMDCGPKNTTGQPLNLRWVKELRHARKQWLYWELKTGRRRDMEFLAVQDDDPEMEALACRRAVQIAADLGLHRVIFEGDSATVINAVTQDNVTLSSYGNIVEDILCLVSSFLFVNFVRVPLMICGLSWICSGSGCGFRWSVGFTKGFLDLGFVAVDLVEFCGQWWFSMVVMGSDMGRFVVGVVVG
nr:hypothetical protein CFP56_40258 [Quercus suber]